MKTTFAPAVAHRLNLLRPLFLAGLVILLAGTGPGCRSLSGPASASFASVVIRGHTPDEIRDALAVVFREEGYLGFQTSPGQWVFEREGSQLNTIARGGLLAAQAGDSTYVRVRTELVDLGGGSYRLQGAAYMVSHKGDSFFEEEVRLANFRRRPYQKLLDDVEERLKK